MFEYLWLLAILACVLLVLAFAKSRRAVEVADPRRAALTKRLKSAYLEIEQAKRLTRRRSEIPDDLNSTLFDLSSQICKVGLYTERLTAREKFAAVFLVNRLFHNGNSEAGSVKNYLQRTILLHHSREIRLRHLKSGDYRGTYELKLGIWITHLPRTVVENGHLERRGKASVLKYLKNLGRKRRPTRSTT